MSIYKSEIFERIDGAVYRAVGSTDAQTGTTYTLQNSDSGKILTFNNASAITVTIPSGLDAGFNITWVQKGAGTVTFSDGVGVTLSNRQGHTASAGQHAVGGLVADVADNYYLTGDTA